MAWIRPSKLSLMLYPLAIVILSILLYLPVVLGIGFLSDDYDLLSRVPQVYFWEAIETHHYSPVTNLLFKTGSPFFIHGVTVFFHTVNALLLLILANRYFKFSRHTSGILALLFLVNPAGYEAIAWCCAVGFVLTGFWLLCALLLFYSGKGTAWRYAWIQVAALLTWDWGTVIAPSLFFLTLLENRSRWRDLIAPCCVWIGYVVLKKSFGADLGYQVNTPFDWVKIFGLTPLLVYFPEGSKAFYSSWLGIAMALAVWMGVLWVVWQRPLARAMLAISVVCLGPVMLMGHPQSRYYYLQAIPFLIIACDFAVSLFKNRAFRMSVGATILLLFITWNQERLLMWLEASLQAHNLGQEIVIASREQPIHVINMPEKLGTDNKIWLPWLWQCGTTVFGENVTFGPCEGNERQAVVYEVIHSGSSLKLVLHSS